MRGNERMCELQRRLGDALEVGNHGGGEPRVELSGGGVNGSRLKGSFIAKGVRRRGSCLGGGNEGEEGGHDCWYFLTSTLWYRDSASV
jgi:hypothetical protein